MYPTETPTQPFVRVPAPVTRHLTSREHELVRALARGLTNRQIAGEFKLSEQTVKNQFTAMYSKLGLSNRLQLAVYAIKNNLA